MKLHGAGRRRLDAGFTLVEMLIALALSGVIAGVTVAAMLTSMSVIDATTAQVADSTDAGLVGAYFYRDAQAVGITDPATAMPDDTLGIATQAAPGDDPWAGCEQDDAFVVRFAWLDGPAVTGARSVVTTYALSSAGALVRKSCDGAAQVYVELARHLSSATATCAPDASCPAATDSVSLALEGSALRNPTSLTLVASVRSQDQVLPDIGTATQVPLLVVGATGQSCSDLSLIDTGAVGVLGSVVVSDQCGASPIGGDMTKLAPTGTIEMRGDVADPLVAVSEPAQSCAAGGPDPSPVGASPTATSTIEYHQPVRLEGAIAFQPGRFVFCAGLTIGAGAVITGSDVFLDVVGGPTSVESTATVDLSAPTTGPYANALLWVSSTEPVTIAAAGRPSTYRGIVHAVHSVVTVTAASPLMIGGLVAGRATLEGTAPLRLGLPIPVISLAPTVWPMGEVGAIYTQTALDAAGGEPAYTWSSTGLPAGLVLDATGTITGTPTSAGSSIVTVTAVDGVLAAGARDFAVTVLPQLTIDAGTALPDGQVGLPYAPAGWTVTGGLEPVSWSATGLPPGLAMSTTGWITGVPTAPGTYTVVTDGIDALGGHASRSDTFTVRAAVAISGPSSLPDASTGVVYIGATGTATGGLAPYGWAATGLPSGLTVSEAGVVSGTATVVGSFGVTLTVTDAAGATASTALQLAVLPSATTFRPVAAAIGFQLFVLADATTSGNSVPGAVAVGGNLTIGGAQVFATGEASTFTATGNTRSDGLAVGAAVALGASSPDAVLTVASGAFQAGNVAGNTVLAAGPITHLLLGVGAVDTASTPRVSVGQQGAQPVLAAGPVPFAAAFSTLRDSADAMAGLTPETCATVATPVLDVGPGGNRLTLVSGKVNIWHVTRAQLATIGPIDGPVRPNDATPLIIVVTDAGTVSLPVRDDPLLRNGLRSAILWDFPAATSVTVDSSFGGTLFAPGADVTMTNLQFEGDVIAASLHLVATVGWLAHFTGTIDCGTPLTVPSTPAPADGQVGVPYSAAALSASGGIAPYRWATSGLPPGLSSSVDGQITGTPTSAGTFTIQATVTDATGVTASATYAIVITARLTIATPTSLDDGTVDDAYSVLFTASGGTEPVTWNAAGVPAGLSMTSGGLLAGTPTSAGDFEVTTTATDARGATATVVLALTVAAASGCAVSSDAWLGEYFSNRNLSGAPTLCRRDAAIAFQWGSGRPDPSIPSNNFSVRWTRTFDIAAGTYDFTKRSDDGWRMYLDGVLVLDDWNYQSYAGSTKIVALALTAGPHTIVAEYFEGNGDAAASLTWAPTAAATCPKARDWLGEYYGGIGFTGTKVLCRDDEEIDFDWAFAAPSTKLPIDRFSVRWTKKRVFNAGTYQFELGSDDGARLYIDGVLVIDAWQNRTFTVSVKNVVLHKGSHTIVLEYYEDTGSARVVLSW